MSKEILDQGEIDNLLGMIASSETEPALEKEAAFSKECLDTIRQIFEETVRRMSKYFASLFENLFFLASPAWMV